MDLSDDITGLPDLDEIDPQSLLIALRFQVGGGIATVDIPEIGATPVHLIAARGLVEDENGEMSWTQAHIAIPRELVRPILEQWLASMDRGEM